MPVGPSENRICPMCGEENAVAERSCHACGEVLGAGDGPAGDGIVDVWRSGKQLVMKKSAQLPYLCVKTNWPADGWLRRKLYWHHPALYLVLLLGPCLYLIVAVVAQQTAGIQVGLCRQRRNRRRWVIALGWLGVLEGFGFIAAGILIARASPGDGTESTAMFVAGLGTILLAVALAGTLTSVVRAAKITRDYVYLNGVHSGFLERLPEFPGESVDEFRIGR